jgi:TPR repeat protein
VQAGKSGQLALAIDYLKKAAALNYGPAEQALGNDYLKGIGVPRDPGMAVKFFSLGVKQNGKASEYGLAKMYEDGNAVPRNEALAIKLYQQSAAQHYGVAEGALGLDYEFGRGVPHNRALAIEYLKRAAIDDNNPTAARYVDILRRAPASTHFSTEIQIATYGAPTMSRPSVQTASRKNNCPEEPVFRTINARNFCSAHPGCPYAVEQMNSYYTHAAPFEHVCGN